MKEQKQFDQNTYTRPFGSFSIVLSWLLAIILCMTLVGATLGGILIVTLGFDLSLDTLEIIVVFCIAHLFLPFWMALAYLLMTPLFQLLKIYVYYSPMLIATRTRSGLALHGGTLFDYVRHMRWSDRGQVGKRLILSYYMQGLLSLINEIEDGHISGEITLSATSYFFSPKNAKRLGFTVKTKGSYMLAGILHYPMLTLTYSYAKGRLSFPSLSRVVYAQIPASKLASRKEQLIKTVSRLSPRTEPAPYLIRGAGI